MCCITLEHFPSSLPHHVVPFFDPQSFERQLQVDYYLALDAHQTVVNSASSFGALLIMERWHAGRYTTYYNGGNIPLEAHMPLYRCVVARSLLNALSPTALREANGSPAMLPSPAQHPHAVHPCGRMPWVFTYNDWSAGTEYDEMVRAAVSSAIKAGRLKPYCMFGGSAESPMYRWLQSHNVTLIQVRLATGTGHTPSECQSVVGREAGGGS